MSSRGTDLRVPAEAMHALYPGYEDIPDGTWLSHDDIYENENKPYGGIHHSYFLPNYGLGWIQYAEYDTASDRRDAWFFLEDGVWYLGGDSEYRWRCHVRGRSPGCDCGYCEFHREVLETQRVMSLCISRTLREVGSSILPRREDGEPSHFREPSIVDMIVRMTLY